MSLTFAIAAEPLSVLGEGPLWDAASGLLHWIDALGGTIFALDPSTGETKSIQVGHEIGCIAIRETGELIVATAREISEIDDSGERQLLVSIPGDDPSLRFNDGKCDSSGRLWVGTMSPLGVRPRAAALYRIDPPKNSVLEIIGHVTTSNGLAWSPDESLLYYVDTATQRVDCFDYDSLHGSLGKRSAFAAIESSAGLPDGLCVDRDGFVWVAVYGAGAIYRYAPNGRLDEKLAVPVRWVTSLTFGGPDLHDLFLTSGTRRMSADERSGQPMAGRLLVSKIDVEGLPSHRYGRLSQNDGQHGSLR